MRLQAFRAGLLLLFACSPNPAATHSPVDEASLVDPRSSERTRPTDPIAQALEAATRQWHEAGRFDGVALVAIDRQLVWTGAFGQADRETGRPLSVETRFSIASITKQFTALLVMQQVERGLLELDAPVSRYLPWYPPAVGEKVSIRDLLSHSSGLREAPDAFFRDDSIGALNAREIVEGHLTAELDFEPGGDFRYTNADYLVLDAILEAKVGRPWREQVEAEIVKPLGLGDTGLAGEVEPTASDYGLDENGAWVRAPAVELGNWRGAGALVSTVGELHLWNDALLSNKLLSAPFSEQMFAPRTDVAKDGSAGNYVALGSWVYPRSIPNSEWAPRLIERRGAIGGYTALSVLIPERKAWIVLLSNRYDEGMHTLPWAECLPLDLLRVVYGLEAVGP